MVAANGLPRWVDLGATSPEMLVAAAKTSRKHQFGPSPARERHWEMLRTLTMTFQFFKCGLKASAFDKPQCCETFKTLVPVERCNSHMNMSNTLDLSRPESFPLTSKPWVQG